MFESEIIQAEKLLPSPHIGIQFPQRIFSANVRDALNRIGQ